MSTKRQRAARTCREIHKVIDDLSKVIDWLADNAEGDNATFNALLDARHELQGAHGRACSNLRLEVS